MFQRVREKINLGACLAQITEPCMFVKCNFGEGARSEWFHKDLRVGGEKSLHDSKKHRLEDGKERKQMLPIFFYLF